MRRIYRAISDELLYTEMQFFLSEKESHHLYKVRRIKQDDSVIVRDKAGRLFLCAYNGAYKKRVCLKALEELKKTSPRIEISIAISIPKSKRADFMIEKLSELGVAEIIPLVCYYSAVKTNTSKVQRWQRITQEAFKQSGSAVVTKIKNFTNFEQAIETFKDYDLKIILHPAHDSTPIKKISDVLTKPEIERVAIMIGPEGGFTQEEISYAVSQGFLKISLSQNILRIETSAICIASLISTLTH